MNVLNLGKKRRLMHSAVYIWASLAEPVSIIVNNYTSQAI